MLGARDKALARERELYDALLDALIARLPVLQGTAVSIAELHVLCFAERAIVLDCVQPELTEEPVLRIEGGRHPSWSAQAASLSSKTMSSLDGSRRR